MSALVNLEADNLTVEPGRTTTAQLSVVNTESIVEQFTIMLLGNVSDWTESDPPVVSLFPGGQQTVTLRFSPPRLYTTPSGEVPFGVKVIPSLEPEESVTEEGVITVGSFNDVGAELVPRVATGRLNGNQKLAVDSRGNVPLPVVVTALDSADAIKFKIRPDKLTTAPGEARYIKVRVKPRQLFWKGHDQHKPYKVQVTPAGESPLVLDGALTQKPVFPKWFWPALLIAGALLLLFFFVLKPIVHNDAVNANKAALAAQQAQTKALANQVNQAQQTAQSANNKALGALALASRKPPATTTTSTTTTTVVKAIVKPAVPKTTTSTTSTTVKPAPPPPPAPVTGPNANRIDVVAGPGSINSSSVTMPSGTTLRVTDIVVQNVSGGLGTATIERIPAGSTTPQILLVENLATLNNQDEQFTFSTPIVFTPGQQLAMSVDCLGQGACEVGMFYTGPMTQPAP
jgi:hypothetical protein